MSAPDELTGWFVRRESLWPRLERTRALYRAHHPAVGHARRLGAKVLRGDVTPTEAASELRERTLGHGLSRPLRSRPGASYLQVVEQPEGLLFLRPVDGEWHASKVGLAALADVADTYVTIVDDKTEAPGARRILRSVSARVDEARHYLTFDLVSLRDLEMIACHGVEPW